VAVVGTPDELWGEVAKVYVVPREGAAPTLEELREHAGGRLARHKLPKAIELVDALPKTATGKVQKHVLRERARESAAHGIAG
jgi:acyl-CoA synthetase (AMP-forming)/AMP-acid ligase II